MTAKQKVNETINSLKIGNKVFIDDGANLHKGFITAIDEESITINEFVADVDRTFKHSEIAEIFVE